MPWTWRRIRHVSFWITIATVNTTAFQNCGPLAESTGASVRAAAQTPATETPQSTQGPLVIMTAPTDGATLSGAITFAAATGGPHAIAGVQFYFNSSPVGAEDVTEPFSITIATSTHPNGNYEVTARVRDALGNVAVSDVLQVTIANRQTR